jgi:N-methylhydantoinase B
VVRDDGTVDEEATAAERERQRTERGPAKDFDFGPPLDEALAACEAETGLPAPSPARPLRWAPLEDPEAAMARARAAAEADGGAAVAPG